MDHKGTIRLWSEYESVEIKFEHQNYIEELSITFHK